MRKAVTPILALMSLGAASMFAQGVVSFTNTGTGLDAPITNAVTGQRLSGSGFLVQCYAGPANTVALALTPIGSSTIFATGPAAGYFSAGKETNDFVLPGTAGTFQARAWTAGFATYEAALAAAQTDPLVMVGTSTVFQNGTGISSPAILTGLQSFGIAPVSEPSLIGFLGCGIAALLCHRRRRR
jgi:hypothetical protein